jgi:hypothetical protein
MFRLMQIEEEISRGLGVPVTITTRNALHPLMKDAIRARRNSGSLMSKDSKKKRARHGEENNR